MVSTQKKCRCDCYAKEKKNGVLVGRSRAAAAKMRLKVSIFVKFRRISMLPNGAGSF